MYNRMKSNYRETVDFINTSERAYKKRGLLRDDSNPIEKIARKSNRTSTKVETLLLRGAASCTEFSIAVFGNTNYVKKVFVIIMTYVN